MSDIAECEYRIEHYSNKEESMEQVVDTIIQRAAALTYHLNVLVNTKLSGRLQQILRLISKIEAQGPRIVGINNSHSEKMSDKARNLNLLESSNTNYNVRQDAIDTETSKQEAKMKKNAQKLLEIEQASNEIEQLIAESGYTEEAIAGSATDIEKESVELNKFQNDLEAINKELENVLVKIEIQEAKCNQRREEEQEMQQTMEELKEIVIFSFPIIFVEIFKILYSIGTMDSVES